MDPCPKSIARMDETSSPGSAELQTASITRTAFFQGCVFRDGHRCSWEGGFDGTGAESVAMWQVWPHPQCRFSDRAALASPPRSHPALQGEMGTVLPHQSRWARAGAGMALKGRRGTYEPRTPSQAVENHCGTRPFPIRDLSGEELRASASRILSGCRVINPGREALCQQPPSNVHIQLKPGD